jgi:hypothetical protein
MDAGRVIDLALCFDAILFGGYLRDIVVAGGTSYNDIDLLWPNDIRKMFDAFVRVLHTEAKDVKVKKVCAARSYCKSDVYRIEIGPTKIDCCLYTGSRADWFADKDVDFTSNLFYRTRDVPLGLRYVPADFRFSPNPVQDVMELTRQRRFRVILTGEGDDVWVRAVNRAYKLVKNDWFMEGEFISGFYEAGLTRAYDYVIRRQRQLRQLMNQKALDVLDGRISMACKEKVRRRLFDECSDVTTSLEHSQGSDTETE